MEVGVRVGGGRADGGGGQRAVERGRPAPKKVEVSAEWRAAVSSRRAADGHSDTAAAAVSFCDCTALPQFLRFMLVLTLLFAGVSFFSWLDQQVIAALGDSRAGSDSDGEGQAAAAAAALLDSQLEV